MPVLTVQNKQFTSGASLPGGHSTPVPSGAVDHESAATLALPDPAHAGQYLTYVFLFWNVSGATNSGMHSTADLDIQIGTGNVTATAWYVQTGGDGPPWTGVYTYTFSESLNQFLTDIPISSVNPAAAWTAGNQKVETNSAVAPSGVDIVALSTMDSDVFDKWLTFSGGTVLGSTLHAAANSAIWAAIAFYKAQAVAVPPDFDFGIIEAVDEWQRIKDKLLLVADPGPDDLWRLKKLLDKAKAEELMGQEDELSRVVSTLDKMTAVQVRGSLAAVKAQITRLDAAQKMLEETMKKMGR